LSVLDIETGERTVVGRAPSFFAEMHVADDLARTWGFSMSEKW